MDDREIVAAIVAGDLAGLAAAYDEHAASLYGYCRWMLSEPEDAADAVEETFVIAAGRLDGLRDPRRLRPWLYAVARNECHARLRASEVGLGEPVGPADPSDLPDPPDSPDSRSGGRGTAERAEVRRLVRTALDGLSPGEREVIELDLRHDLQGADLAAVIGVPRNQAHTLASHARGEVEKALGALFVARTGRRACAELDLLLDGWDGQLTASTRKLVSRHIQECGACADRSHGALGAAVRYGMAPLAELPTGLREEILGLCADTSPEALSYRREVTQRAGAFLPNGFPQAVRAPRRRIVALSGVAAAVGVLVAVMATGIVTVLALTGSHAPRQAAAGSSPGSASAPASGDAGTAGATSPGESPTTSAPPFSSAPPLAAPESISPTTAKPSPSRTTASPAPQTSTPGFTSHPPTPTPTSTVTSTFTSPPPSPSSTTTSPPPNSQ
jgi:RNA polymerase sigma factor (sigma-70 family)